MDLVQRRKQLRQRQVDKVKKFRQSNMSVSAAVQKQKEREEMKKEIRKEIEKETQKESMNIENSDGTTFARVMNIVGPTHMRPVVSNGVWKGTEQISEKMEEDDESETDDQQQKQIDSKQKKADQIKKQVLLKKLQAVRQGGGSEIMASYDWKSDDSMRIVKVAEGSLHKWFNASKSKDGKKGWVQSDGSPCANEPGETKTPKCYSSAKRASMTKKELRSADARKSRQDPNQQQKSGAAKPTYVRTDAKKKMNEDKVLKKVAKELTKASKMHKGQAEKIKKHADDMKKVDEACWDGYTQKGMKKKGKKVVPNCVKEEDVKGKGSGKKDACYHKVKASAKVWPSAYASGRLVQCRKKGAANYGKSKSESYSWRDEFDYVQEGAAWTKKSGKSESGGLNEKGRKSYERENPGSDLKRPQPEGGSRKKSFCARMGGMKKKLTSKKTANDPNSRINKALRKWKC